MTVGYCVGEISLSELTFISDKMPQVGEYVTVEYDGKRWKLGLLTVEKYSSEDIPSIDETIPELYLTATGKKNT